MLHCIAPTTLHSSAPLHCTHYTSPTLLHCTSLHPHYYSAWCTAVQRTSASQGIALYCMVQCYTLYRTSLHFTVRCRSLQYTVFYNTSPLLFTVRGSAVLHTALCFTALHCSVQRSTLQLYFTNLQQHCTPLHFTAQCSDLHCTSLAPHFTLPHCMVQCTSLYFTPNNVLHCTALSSYIGKERICTCTGIMTTASSSLNLAV